LQRPYRPQNIEMKGLLEDDGEDKGITIRIEDDNNNNNGAGTVNTNVNNNDLRVLDAIKLLVSIKTEQLDMAQLDGLIEFHQRQLAKFTEAKVKLEERRRQEMERLLMD